MVYRYIEIEGRKRVLFFVRDECWERRILSVGGIAINRPRMETSRRRNSQSVGFVLARRRFLFPLVAGLCSLPFSLPRRVLSSIVARKYLDHKIMDQPTHILTKSKALNWPFGPWADSIDFFFLLF